MMRTYHLTFLGLARAACRFAGAILFCGLALGMALASFLHPAVFWEEELYNSAYRNLEHEETWQEALNVLFALRTRAWQLNIREASSYTTGTFLAESNDPRILSVALNSLDDANAYDPSDENVKINMEIVRNKLRAISSANQKGNPSDLDQKIKDFGVKVPEKTGDPDDKSRGRGGSSEDAY